MAVVTAKRIPDSYSPCQN